MSCMGYYFKTTHAIASQRKTSSPRNLGVWHGGHISHPCSWLHGSCATAYNSHPTTIINAHVAAGTEVHSDDWRAYSHVSSVPNVSSHGVVNHSLTFVDPTTGSTHTACGIILKPRKNKAEADEGVPWRSATSHLDEFMWRERYGKTRRQALDNLMNDIAQQFPV